MDQKYLGNIVKTALIFAVIGAALFLLAPQIGMLLGIESIAGSAAGQALFFGLFGTGSALLTPLVDKLFSKPSLPAAETPAPAITKEAPARSHAISSPTPDVYLNSEPPLAAVENAAPSKSFVDTELARRSAPQTLATSAQIS